jgi:hypothetical protein
VEQHFGKRQCSYGVTQLCGCIAFQENLEPADVERIRLENSGLKRAVLFLYACGGFVFSASISCLRNWA